MAPSVNFISFLVDLLVDDAVVIGDSDNCPLTHKFAPGVYVREIFIPAGMCVVGKIHKHAHPNFLLKGKVIVITEQGGRELLEAPLSMISPAGTIVSPALYVCTIGLTASRAA